MQVPMKWSPQLFYDSLPLEFAMCGWRVRLTARADGRVGFEILGEQNTTPKSFDVSDWKWMAFHRKGHITASRNELGPFFKFFLKCPIGTRVLTFGAHERVNEKRIKALTYSFDAWRRLGGPRDKGERLKEALYCIAYVETGYVAWDGCSNRTKDPSGLCHHHNHPGAKTLWNYDPFQQMDALWSDIEEGAKEEAASRRDEGARQTEELDEERRRRKARWQDVAATLRYTATDRQVYFLLELGAAPSQLIGITKKEASLLIDKMLYG